ncbi:MAG: 30S ribosomal protein S21 [Candidatus Andersenbacteria bacterium]|nr:30S ribosomal protein S21 [bacterium]MDZ4225382.1 30S ribosomal protein S21 [Candidatus Andersenbacteria bacterium]
MVEVKRRDNEGSDSVVRRFSRKVQQSGVLLQARKIRFHTRKKNRRRMREEAQRRTELQAEREHLIKIGELDEFSALSYRPQGRSGGRR